MACLRFGTDALGKEILELVRVPPRQRPASASASKNEEKEGRGTSDHRDRGTTGAAAADDDDDDDAHGEEEEEEEEEEQEEEGGGVDESGKPYKGENTIVMMEWEKPYMRALVDALRITEKSDVLEIGFGCGYSADRIQELSPRTHTIVEPDPVVLARLRGWAASRRGVRVVEGFWQTALATLGKFDAVFFDDFPLPGTPDSSDLRGPVSRWHAFIDLCVAHHLPIGGRITGYLARPLPLARPGCEMASPLVAFPVDVPDNCPYFPYREAYVPLITRVEIVSEGRGVGAGGGGGVGGDDDADARMALVSSLLSDGDDSGRSRPGRTFTSERKRQKRQALEALVRDSLGL